MELEEVFEKRFSARRYNDRKVEKEKLEEILNAGRIAPTACNNQPQRFLIVESEEAIQKLDSVTAMRYGAPCVIIVCSDMNDFKFEGSV